MACGHACGAASFFAHGERQHHHLYDQVDRARQLALDAREAFISFPLRIVAPAGLLPVALVAWLIGWRHGVVFGATLFGCVALDHRLHVLFHRRERLRGPFGWLQRFHRVHHATHDLNFFFATGLPWDVLFRSIATTCERAASRRASPRA